MKKYLIILFFFFLLFEQLIAQNKVGYSFAERKTRDSIKTRLITQINTTISLPLHASTYEKYTGAYWAMELMLYRPDGYQQKMVKQVLQLPSTSPDFQRAFLEMLYTLYQGKFIREVNSVWPKLANDKVKAMALEYLAEKKVFPVISKEGAFYNSSYCKNYIERWEQKVKSLPSKNVFLDSAFLPGQAVLCSFQSTDRNRPGYLMIRNEKGKWVTDNNGRPLQFTQLARAISNLPYYITNGNTPQGLYKITGFDSLTNNWIGPTTALQMLLPFENAVTNFFKEGSEYIEQYKKLLGPLSRYNSLLESFKAGQSGRTEIIAHGTTIDPSFYVKQQYYPNTPSLGCLCSPEQWNDQGERVYSSQMDWINEVKKLTKQPAYLIVAEVKDL